MDHLWAADRRLIGGQAAAERSPIGGLSASHQRVVKAAGDRSAGGRRQPRPAWASALRSLSCGSDQTSTTTSVLSQESAAIGKNHAASGNTHMYGSRLMGKGTTKDAAVDQRGDSTSSVRARRGVLYGSIHQSCTDRTGERFNETRRAPLC